MLRIGLVLFVIASVTRLLFHPAGELSRNFVHGLEGALYGAAIAFLLMNLITQRRRKERTGSCV